MLSFITLGTLWKICLRCSKIYIKIYMCIRLCICTVYMYMNMYKKWLLRLSFHNSRLMTKATILVNILLRFSPFASPTGLSRECRQSKLNVSSRQVHVSFPIPHDKQTNKQKTIDLFTDTAAILILPTGHPIILD